MNAKRMWMKCLWEEKKKTQTRNPIVTELIDAEPEETQLSLIDHQERRRHTKTKQQQKNRMKEIPTYKPYGFIRGDNNKNGNGIT